MNNTRLILLHLLLILSVCSLSGQNTDPFLWEQDEIICKERERASFHLDPRDHRNAFADQTDIYYQEMKWEIDPAIRYIRGEITYYFKSKKDNLTEMHLDLTNALQVNSIQRNSIDLSFIHSNDQLLTIELGESLAIGQSDTFTIIYEGIPPSNGFGSFGQNAHAGQPIIWTLSEPYGVRDWWPGKQDLMDKVDSVDIYITTPPGQLAASNGKLMSITESGDKLVHHWSHRHPIATYLIALAVTNYSAYSHFLPLENGDTIEILNYVYPETLIQSQQATASSLDIMGLYNELFGTYPFADEKYGHAEFGWGGGMEHQTMSFMGGFSFGLQAHEMAHQWFGDKVTCGSWKDIWLNEGFATYLSGLTLERFSPDQYWPQWRVSTSNSATSQPGGSVIVDDTSSVNRIFSGRLSYNKGAYLLHMLRWVIGEEAFFGACRDYLDSPGTAYDFGTTDELQTYLEARSGKNLDEFFADWYYGQGYPSYDLRWNQKSDSLIIWLGQRQSHPSVSFFEMPVPVYASWNGSGETFVLPHTEQDQRFAFYIGNNTIDSIEIDPIRWILSKDNSITELTTSTYQPVAQNKYLIYPNPVKSFIEIIPFDDVSSADIIDVSGRMRTEGLSYNRIDVSKYSSGFYSIVLKNEQGIILSIQSVVIIK